MIVVHVGLKKAGSKSIQAFLKRNEDTLRTMSIDYAQIGRQDRGLAHHNFAREIIAKLKKFDRSVGTLSRLAKYWQRAPGSTLILSSELFEEADVEEIRNMQNTLGSARKGEEFRIVIIIRDLLELMPSSYAQKTKFGTTTINFDEFFEERMKARRVDYFSTVKRWADVFGWENVCVRLLDRNYLINGDVVDDFMSLCGVELSDMPDSIVRPGHLNISPGWKTLEAARALFGGRHGLPENHPLTQAASPKRGKILPQKERIALGGLVIKAGDKRGWNENKGLYMTRVQAEWCREVYRTGIDALNKLVPRPFPHPPDLESQGFVARDFLPDVDCIPTDELLSVYAEVELRRIERASHRKQIAE